MNKLKILHYSSTGLLTAMMLMSVSMYLFKHGDMVQAFTSLGYPPYLIYPLAAAKLLGLAAIWSGVSRQLRNLAYAGFFYDFVLAAAAHLMAADGSASMSFVALALLAASFWSRSRLGEEKLTTERSPLKMATNAG